jgi:ABC-type nitrate/sulfonate/bicarbonate transport system permease component
MRNAWRVDRWLPPAVGILVLLGVWELLARTAFHGTHTVPTPWQTVHGLWVERQFYPANVEPTVLAAAKGFVIGNAVAIALAVVCVLLPWMERLVMPFAVVVYSVPIIAVAPILVVLFRGDTPRVVLAALSVFFTTLVGANLGLRSADSTILEVVRAYGGGPVKQLVKVRLWASVPAVLGAFKIAAPSALLGAIIGEFLGADRGLGSALVIAQQNLDAVRTWGIALVVTAIACALYVAIGLVERAVAPWQQGRT